MRGRNESEVGGGRDGVAAMVPPPSPPAPQGGVCSGRREKLSNGVRSLSASQGLGRGPSRRRTARSDL
uniref:Uncharacterized protein n=1 Tax=Arundo donax TaxID=35708 RepID=A0A0A9FRA2_ARUDO